MIEALRKSSKDYLSNVYFSNLKLIEILNKDTACVIASDGILCICDRDISFLRAYWYVDSSERFRALAMAINKSCGDTSVISELVGTDTQLRFVAGRMEQAGFEHYKSLIFMSRKPLTLIDSSDKQICYPSLEEAREIYTCLYAAFDVKVSHLPSLPEVEEYIGRKEITAIYDSGKIIAFSIFQKTGRVSKYLYQLWVDPDYRGKGHAKALLEAELSANRDIVYTLWVETDNISARRLYESLGFINNDRLTMIMRMGGNSNGQYICDTAGTQTGV
jgi:ribosomal protein S18 acetylase RimI-like enzyme